MRDNCHTDQPQIQRKQVANIPSYNLRQHRALGICASYTWNYRLWIQTDDLAVGNPILPW
jgi:hypothetical protein